MFYKVADQKFFLDVFKFFLGVRDVENKRLIYWFIALFCLSFQEKVDLENEVFSYFLKILRFQRFIFRFQASHKDRKPYEQF